MTNIIHYLTDGNQIAYCGEDSPESKATDMIQHVTCATCISNAYVGSNSFGLSHEKEKPKRKAYADIEPKLEELFYKQELVTKNRCDLLKQRDRIDSLLRELNRRDSEIKDAYRALIVQILPK